MTDLNRQALPAGRIINATAYCLVGPIVWSLHLGLVYAVHHVACRAATPAAGQIAAFVIGLTLVAAVALIAAWRFPKRLAGVLRCPADDAPMAFFTPVMRWLAILSACGIVWTGAGALFLAACAR